MSKTSVLVIGGGPSPEREIALLSSKAVFNALDGDKYDKEFYDWDGSSKWLQENLPRFDVVLPALHGVGGEDGVIQKILEDANVPFLGSDSTVSELCFDKTRTIEKIQGMSIPTPEGNIVSYEQYKSHPLAGRPHVLKPHHGGSSIDTFIVADVKEAPLEQIKTSFAKYNTMLLEEFVDGVEITVPLLDGKVLPTIEIRPPKNGTFDYINKYNGKSIELCPPEKVTDEEQAVANTYAKRIYDSFGCRHLARIDMIIRAGEVIVMEINTMPGMTAHSLYPKAPKAVGISFEQLVEKFVELAKGDG